MPPTSRTRGAVAGGGAHRAEAHQLQYPAGAVQHRRWSSAGDAGRNVQPGSGSPDALGKAYGVLANVFIQREEQIYQQSETDNGGWRDLRAFRILKKQPQSDVICSFVLAPVDGGRVADFKPAIPAVYIKHDSPEHQEIRQYSLTTSPNGEFYRIAVKREDQESIQLPAPAGAGRRRDLHRPPHGDFFLDVAPTTPVALISPASAKPQCSACSTPCTTTSIRRRSTGCTRRKTAACTPLPMRADIAGRMPNLSRHVWYREPGADDVEGRDYHSRGLMDLSALQPGRSADALLLLRPGGLHAVRGQTAAGDGRRGRTHPLRMFRPA